MNYLPFALLAYILNAIAVLIDKFMLSKKVPDPLLYVFYFSTFSLVALLIIPFIKAPTLGVYLTAASSTLLWTTGAYFMFMALQRGQVSRVIPVIGTLVPFILFIEALRTQTISYNQAWAVGLLIAGLIFITLSDWKGKLGYKELVLEILSALFFAISYLVLKQAYLQENFLTVLVWSRTILIPVGLIILAIPTLRGRILKSGQPILKPKSKTGLLFVGGQLAGGSAELLITFSISLATPALVNSLQGAQYALLFIFSLLLSKKFPEIFQESVQKFYLLSKLIGILFIAAGLYLLATVHPVKVPTLGATFSSEYAKSLGLDPQKTFAASLTELKIKHYRIPIYWSEVEKTPGNFDFSLYDQLIKEAQQQNAQIILAIGYKVPRWPECYTPDWVKKLSTLKRQVKVLNLLQKTVDHFKSYPNISGWQVENEPFIDFGQCELNTPQFLATEIATVKKLDSRPISTTDSGEWGYWAQSMKSADYLGISVYRKAWNPVIGYNTYPFPPFMYNLKAWLIKNLFAPDSRGIYISELQAEPWPDGTSIPQTPIEQQIREFSLGQFASNINYAKETSFDKYFLWGVEWWYWMKEKNHPEYWQLAKKLFNP